MPKPPEGAEKDGSHEPSVWRRKKHAFLWEHAACKWPPGSNISRTLKPSTTAQCGQDRTLTRHHLSSESRCLRLLSDLSIGHCCIRSQAGNPSLKAPSLAQPVPERSFPAPLMRTAFADQTGAEVANLYQLTAIDSTVSSPLLAISIFMSTAETTEALSSSRGEASCCKDRGDWVVIRLIRFW